MAIAPAAVVRFRRKFQWKREYWWYSPFIVQWLALMVFSTIQFNRFALTHDFAAYWQAIWLIAHGHWNPYSTVMGYPFLDNHFELIIYLIAPLVWLWPHASLLLYIQDTVLISAEWIAWIWITASVSSRKRLPRDTLKALGICLLVLNPWTYWTSAFDFHTESLMTLTIIGAAYALWRRDRRALTLWVGLTLLAGDVAALLIVGLGLTALLRREWRTSLSLVVSGMAWLLVIGAIGANKGSVLVESYGYLFTRPVHLSITQLIIHILLHPEQASAVLWQRKLNIWANISSSGILGLFSPWGLGVILTTLIPSSLTAHGLFSEPGFQNIIIAGLVTVGTISTLQWVSRYAKKQWMLPAISFVLVVNTLGWAVAWLPRLPSTWIRVSPAASHTLATIQYMIPRGAELIVPQAIIGRFANRVAVYPMMGGNHFSLSPTRSHYLIMAPYQGIHLSSITLMASELKDLADSHRATLVYEHHGVYLWRIRGSAPLNLPMQTTLPAWAFQSQTGRRVFGSSPQYWYVTGLGHNGNILDQAYWREPNGTYQVTVQWSGWGPAQIQVWDASTGRLVANRYVPLANGQKVTTTYRFAFTSTRPTAPYAGWGLWQTQPISGPKNNQLEVRVEANASSMVNVYQVGLTKAQLLQ